MEKQIELLEARLETLQNLLGNGSSDGISRLLRDSIPQFNGLGKATEHYLKNSEKEVKDWVELKRLMIKHFIPAENKRRTLKELQDLKQVNSINSYINEFKLLISQVEVPIDLQIHWFLNGLKQETQLWISSNEANLESMDFLEKACRHFELIKSSQP
ncbi:hypothetical protein HMI56_000513 [Coelomomyces lativittatus]|nr:hypothetical protein HMI56_000513 [Coelomomyces lativittatus]